MVDVPNQSRDVPMHPDYTIQGESDQFRLIPTNVGSQARHELDTHKGCSLSRTVVRVVLPGGDECKNLSQ